VSADDPVALRRVIANLAADVVQLRIQRDDFAHAYVEVVEYLIALKETFLRVNTLFDEVRLTAQHERDRALERLDGYEHQDV